jgi:hypothetical protein
VNKNSKGYFIVAKQKIFTAATGMRADAMLESESTSRESADSRLSHNVRWESCDSRRNEVLTSGWWVGPEKKHEAVKSRGGSETTVACPLVKCTRGYV